MWFVFSFSSACMCLTCRQGCYFVVHVHLPFTCQYEPLLSISFCFDRNGQNIFYQLKKLHKTVSFLSRFKFRSILDFSPTYRQKLWFVFPFSSACMCLTCKQSCYFMVHVHSPFTCQYEPLLSVSLCFDRKSQNILNQLKKLHKTVCFYLDLNFIPFYISRPHTGRNVMISFRPFRFNQIIYFLNKK